MFIITGGTSGIGKEVAFELARRQHNSLIIGRREQLLRTTAAFSPLITWCCADIATNAGQARVLEHVAQLSKVSSVHGIIHNAGIINPIIPLSKLNKTDWEYMLATNLSAPLYLSQQLLPKMHGGRVLHISSGAAHFPVYGWSGYCITKAALAMLTHCWQLEIDASLVAFASVMPGIIDTDMQYLIRHAKYMQPEKLQFFKNLFSEKRLLAPTTVALFICWLLLMVPAAEYAAQEWDIYDTKHHLSWLIPPHQVPSIHGEI